MRPVLLCAGLGIFLTGCFIPPEENITTVSEVKVSYFTIPRSAVVKEPSGYYIALISRGWFAAHQKKLGEPFEQLRLPPPWPLVKIAPNDVIEELLDWINKEGFYSLPSIDLGRFTVSEMERPDFTAYVLTVQKGKSIYSVSMTDLPPEKINQFLRIRNIFLKNFMVLESPEIKIETESLQDFLKKHLPQPPDKE
jgi:hypothetical protein